MGLLNFPGIPAIKNFSYCSNIGSFRIGLNQNIWISSFFDSNYFIKFDMCLNSKVGTSQLESVFKLSRNPLPINITAGQNYNIIW